MSFEQNHQQKGFETGVRDEASCVVQQQESSGESGTTLKAHDYIGLSEVTSMPINNAAKPLPDLNLGETELRLGPPKNSPKSDKNEKNEPDQSANNVFWSAPRMMQQEVKNSNNKRAFSEAIGSVEGRSVMPSPSIAPSPSPAPNPSPSNASPAPKSQLMPSPMYPWNSSKQLPAAWRMGLEQSKASFGPFPATRKLNESSENNSPNGSGLTSNKEDAAEDTPPSNSPPVVGWPPVQSFRKNTLASHPPAAPPQKPSTQTENKPVSAPPATANASGSNTIPANASSSPLFVKVYMDGVPIGRKVDLKANNSYEKLSAVLEDMFHRFISGQNGAPEASSTDKKLNFLQSSDFVLTYEDRDGDLMLVGDVPWGMFTGTVKRLRIMKGSEAIGLAPRAGAGDKA